MTSTLWILAQGAAITLFLAFVGVIGGTIFALLLNAAAFSKIGLMRICYHTYIYFARGIPLLVQALLIFYTLPAFGILIGPLTAGALVLTLYIGAMFAEVFRGGVLAIPRTLWDSTRSLGLPPVPVLRKVVIPLVLRYTLPSYINVCVLTIKASSVLSVISVWELTLAAREIVERTLDVFPIMIAASCFYFVMCFSFDRLGRHVEHRLALRGFSGERP